MIGFENSYDEWAKNVFSDICEIYCFNLAKQYYGLVTKTSRIMKTYTRTLFVFTFQLNTFNGNNVYEIFKRYNKVESPQFPE